MKNTFYSLVLFIGAFLQAPALYAAEKPNILVIWGDDIGIWNISRYSMGQMGYQTPAIDRIANEGTDLYRLLRRAKLHRRDAPPSLPGSTRCAPA